MQARCWFNGLRRGFSSDPVPVAIGFVLLGGTILASLTLGAGMLFLSAVLFSSDELPWLVAALLGSLTMLGVLGGVSGEATDLPDARHLQVFPLRRRELVWLDLLAGAVSPTLLFCVPATFGIALGAAVGHLTTGRPIAAVVAFTSTLIGFAVSAALIRIVIASVQLGGRWLREVVGLVVLMLFMGLAFLAPLVAEWEESGGSSIPAIAFEAMRLTHFGAAGRLAGSWKTGALASVVDALVLATWTAGTFTLHRRLTHRILDGEGGIHRASRRESRPSRIAALLERLLPGPVLGVAAADFRTLSRMPAMWFLLVFPIIFGFVLGRPSHSAGDSGQAEMAAEWMPAIAAIFAVVLFSGAVFSNIFGVDHAGSALWLLAPVKTWHLLLGKGLSRFAFAAAQMSLYLSVLFIRFGLESNDAAWIFAGWLATALWVCAGGNLMSIRLPFRMPHGMTRERSGSRGMTALLSQAIVLVLVLPPSAMILGGRALAGDFGFQAGVLTTLVSGVILWIVSVVLADELIASRGTEMVAELSRTA